MDGKGNARLLALGASVAVATLVQGCAVVTRPYVAERAPVSSHSMVSRFDQSRLQADGTMPSHGSSLYIPRGRERGMFFFRY
jgi:hypothetical protein